MPNYSINKKPLIFFLVFALLISVVTLVIIHFVDRWKNDIIQGKKLLTEVVVSKLNEAVYNYIDDLSKTNFFNEDSLAKYTLDSFDSKLKKITYHELILINGMEGGFYFPQFDEFYGYSFPTSPPPAPAFGPPPRSYNIIKKQVLQSIVKDSLIIGLHSFDPAVFPLATQTIKINNQIIGVAWARIHLERDLPGIQLNQILKFAAFFFLIGFIITLITTLKLKKRMEIIKSGLVTLENDPSFRFTAMTGVFGFIGSSINSLVERMTEVHEQKQYLEKELYQQDKLATLGKLIAGVAHEVKTPLAIIKTRIQIWQHELNKQKHSAQVNGIITLDSMEFLVKEINRLTTLVKRLLIFSKPISDNFQSFNLNKLLNQTISLLQIENNDRIKIETKFDDEIPLFKCDPNSLEQVFINIITNCIEASSSEDTILIETSYKKSDNTINIKYYDNGNGISPEIKDKLFDPFFTTKQNGVGLGLSISYEIIKAHRGELFFQNNSPKGTICSIKFTCE